MRRLAALLARRLRKGRPHPTTAPQPSNFWRAKLSPYTDPHPNFRRRRRSKRGFWHLSCPRKVAFSSHAEGLGTPWCLAGFGLGRCPHFCHKQSHPFPCSKPLAGGGGPPTPPCPGLPSCLGMLWGCLTWSAASRAAPGRWHSWVCQKEGRLPAPSPLLLGVQG